MPRPDVYPCCQTGGHGLLLHRLHVPPGVHTLTIGSGYLGTDLPRFEEIEFSFTVEGTLPRTGWPVSVWTGVAVILVLCGLWLALRVRSAPG